MRLYFFKAVCMLACVGLLSTDVLAQDKNENWNDNDEIVIKRKGDKNAKVTVEINDDEVKVNGKPLSEYKDDNVVIRKRKSNEGTRLYTPGVPRSPFRGGSLNVDDHEYRLAIAGESNKALLGVITNKDENGAKITSVTKGSAAEKAGLKEGDVITRVNDAEIEDPEDLIEAVAKYKPEEKVNITYKRDKKEQKAGVTLGSRAESTYNREFFNNRDFNFDLSGPDGAFNMVMGGSPRLGIKAQDTDDGKGVKVLDVNEGSNAEKAGIKEGDIITEFDGKSVNSATELASGAKEAKEKSSIKVRLQREGKSQEVEIKVPKKLKTTTL